MASVITTVALFIVAPANAKPKKLRVTTNQTIIACNQQGCSDTKPTAVSYTQRATRGVVEAYRGAVTFLKHPAGCPPKQFCACGAAVDLFGGNGRDYRHLWPARAWFKFPRSHSPSAGDVAVRKHHVFVLRAHIEGDIWMTADYNSGGNLSRLQPQSIRGYTIVSPSRTHVAQRN